MRTTLDIDEDILTAAKELAGAQRTTAGRVISDLVRLALTQPAEGDGTRQPVLKDGWYVLPSRGGIVTSEMVERLLEEADREDAGLEPD